MVARVESHRNLSVSILSALAFALAVCLVSSLASAQTEKEATKSEWTYFYKYKEALGCFSTDITSANAAIADVAAGGNLCDATFTQWDTAWPDGKGITDQFNFCPPSGIPAGQFNWAMQHWEDRTAKWTYRTNCNSSLSETTLPVTRHFLYYCADTNYHLAMLSNDPPKIPICRINDGKPVPAKQTRGCCASQGATSVGDPIDVATGNMFQRETDYRGNGFSPLQFERQYNSSGDGDGSLGANWRHTYSRSIERISITPTAAIAHAHRPDGRIITFDNATGSWASQPDIAARLTRTSSPLGWTYTDESDTVETYDDTGRLLSIATRSGAVTTLTYDTFGVLTTVTDFHGRQLAFTYDTSGRIHVVTVPGGGTYVYGYDTANNLTSVTAPDSAVRTYVYNESANTSSANLPHALTGIIDENNDRFATWKYDATGRGIRSEHAGGADRVDIVYNVDGTSTVTDALGAVRTHTMIVTQAVQKLSSVSGVPCRECGEAASYSYDTSGRLSEWRDARNTLFQRTYTTDGRNLVAGEWKASGTFQAQNTTYTWHASYRLPLTISLGSRRQTFTYDSSGNVLTRTITDTGVTPNVTRTSAFTYNSIGQVLTVDGPRTDVADVTTYTYYTCTTGVECGQVQTITNALGHVTTYNTYNAHGQPLTITDPNGVVTTLTYDARQRLTSRSVGSEQTTFTYWPSGLLKKTTLPDGSFLEYGYDAAHRLTSIEDSEGNHISYTLDARGNRTAEQTYDPSNVLTQTRTRVFNSLNQLWKDIGAAGTSNVTTEFAYDGNHNPTSTSAPLSRTTLQGYDELDRVKQITDPLLGLTKYSYNNLDQLISVIDPRNKETTYTYTAFGDPKQQVSPDTGTTTNTYDSGGNLATSTDARNKTGTYGYDALNRVTSLTYPDQTIGYTYDTGTNEKGRLKQVTDASGSTSWSYDTHGRVLSRQQSMGVSKTLGYAYDSAGRLQTLTLPSGNAITYSYTDGKITSLLLNGSTTILSNVLYQPFGPTRGWTWGNSTLAVREYDDDGKVTDIDSAGLKTYSYDDAFRITGIADASDSSLSQGYSYDANDRLAHVFASAPSSLTMDLSTTSAAPGDTVAVTLGGVSAGGVYWLALARSGAPLKTYSKWIQVTPSSGGFVWNVTMPSFAGNYEVRLFGAGFSLQRTSAAISVSSPPPPSQPTLTVNAASVGPGSSSVTVHLANAPGGTTDWIGLALVGAPTNSYVQYTYVGWGVTNRDWTVTLPSTEDDYEFRFFLNNGYVLNTASAPVWVKAQPPVGGGLITDGYSYDANGNRLSDASSTYTISSTSNRLTSVNALSYGYDTSGNVTSDGTRTFGYNDAGRMTSATKAGVTTTYALNALGQRVKKTTSGSSTYFVYDEAGHLVGEYNGSGSLIQETVWLGDIPVATLRPNGGGVNVFYVHTDHLNTPRRVSRPSDNAIVWRWDADPFGAAAANEDPDGDSTSFVYNLRFPGQYFDAETRLHYNYFRDYDPATGRYPQSDPIGLRGGINTYAYADQNPTQNTDPSGLLVKAPWSGCTDFGWAAIQRAEQRIRDELKKPCVCTPESNGSCIPCNLRSQLLNALDTGVVRCPMGTGSGEVCGWGELGGNGMKILPPGFKDYGCGCLALTIYHELLHNLGYYDFEIPPMERACGGLCASGKSGGPTRRRR
jgi:RHS repeat-associated protein